MLSFLLGTHCVVEFEFVVAAGEVGQGGVKAACRWGECDIGSVNCKVLTVLGNEPGQKERPDPRM